MPKRERQPQIEAQTETQYPFHEYEKIYRDVCNEILELKNEIGVETKWLEDHCQKLMEYFHEYDPPELVELRNTLEETRDQLQRQSYSLLYGSKKTRYFYGEISEAELNR
jgi:hypothetical protein